MGSLSRQVKEISSSIREPVGLLSDLLFLVGCVITVLVPQLLVVINLRPPFTYLVLLVVTWSLGSILGLTLYGLKRRSSQKRETIRVLKTHHKEFFQQIRLTVVHLLEKS